MKVSVSFPSQLGPVVRYFSFKARNSGDNSCFPTVLWALPHTPGVPVSSAGVGKIKERGSGAYPGDSKLLEYRAMENSIL